MIFYLSLVNNKIEYLVNFVSYKHFHKVVPRTVHFQLIEPIIQLGKGFPSCDVIHCDEVKHI